MQKFRSRAGPSPCPSCSRSLGNCLTPAFERCLGHVSLPCLFQKHSSRLIRHHPFLPFLGVIALFLFWVNYPVTMGQHHERDSSLSGTRFFSPLHPGSLDHLSSRLSPHLPSSVTRLLLLPQDMASSLETILHLFGSLNVFTFTSRGVRRIEKNDSVTSACAGSTRHTHFLSARSSRIGKKSPFQKTFFFLPFLSASAATTFWPSSLLSWPPVSSSRMPFFSSSLPSVLHVQALPPLATPTAAITGGTAGAIAAAKRVVATRTAAESSQTAAETSSDATGLAAPNGNRILDFFFAGNTRRKLQETRTATPHDVVADSQSSHPSLFFFRSILPFFPSPAGPQATGNGGTPQTGNIGSSAVPSSSLSSDVPPSSSLSSLPSHEEEEGNAKHREKAAAPPKAPEETGEGLAGGGNTGAEIGSVKARGEKLAASLTNVNMLLLAFCLLCCFTLGYFIHVNLIPHLPDSAAAMLTGVVFGLLARLWGSSPSENSFLHFDPEFFYFVLLPPIVLEAGFCLNKAAFLYNLGPIVSLSIFGTLLSTVIIAKVTLHTAHICGLEGPPHELRGFSWVFASLISATDTVATLSIIGSPKFRLDEKGVDLYSILMGESVLNDAVSIALTRSCLRLFFTAEAEAAQRASGADVIVDFLAVLVGSLILGIGIGGLCCYCFRHSKLKKLPEYEVAITILTAYMAFGVAECFGFSGVVSLFFCGVMLGHFNVHNMSSKSRNSIDTVFKTIALLSEKTVFAYLGVVAAIGVGQRSFNVFFVLIALSACALSRAACVFPMSFISNRFRKKDERIDWKQQILIWLAGLRGAVAFALAMTIPCSFDFWRAVCRHNKDLVVTTTLILVAITTVGVGSILEYTAVKLGAVQPRRRSLPVHGYDASSPSSALLLLEHLHYAQDEHLVQEESCVDGSKSYTRSHQHEGGGVLAPEGEEGETAAVSSLFGSTSPTRDSRREDGQHSTAAEEMLKVRATARGEVAQEMTTAAATLLRGPFTAAAGVQQQQHGGRGSEAHRQPQRTPLQTTGSPARSTSSEQRWRRDTYPSPPSSTGPDETSDTENHLARRKNVQDRHTWVRDRLSRYDLYHHQPFLRFLYRLDREYLQLWLGGSGSPPSSGVVADPPSAAEALPENGATVLRDTLSLSPCYYDADKSPSGSRDGSCTKPPAIPQVHGSTQR